MVAKHSLVCRRAGGEATRNQVQQPVFVGLLRTSDGNLTSAACLLDLGNSVAKLPANMISTKAQYTPLAQESEDSLEDEPKIPSRRRHWRVVVFAAAVVVVTALGLLFVSLTATAGASCSNPILRREWRALSTSEKSEYLRAVQCLHDLPSGLGLGGKRSDDFPWIHFNVGNYGTCSSFSYTQ
jgi:hypothetical protein